MRNQSRDSRYLTGTKNWQYVPIACSAVSIKQSLSMENREFVSLKKIQIKILFGNSEYMENREVVSLKKKKKIRTKFFFFFGKFTVHGNFKKMFCLKNIQVSFFSWSRVL